jgi:hypothetical protein
MRDIAKLAEGARARAKPLDTERVKDVAAVMERLFVGRYAETYIGEGERRPYEKTMFRVTGFELPKAVGEPGETDYCWITFVPTEEQDFIAHQFGIANCVGNIPLGVLGNTSYSRLEEGSKEIGVYFLQDLSSISHARERLFLVPE